jgi:DNA-binding MarR family transcriptional regulator
VVALAERLQLRHHSAVGLIDRLVSQKLVARTPSTRDRRQVFVQLTPRRAGAGTALRVARPATEAVGPEFTPLLQKLSGVDQ